MSVKQTTVYRGPGYPVDPARQELRRAAIISKMQWHIPDPSRFPTPAELSAIFDVSHCPPSIFDPPIDMRAFGVAVRKEQ